MHNKDRLISSKNSAAFSSYCSEHQRIPLTITEDTRKSVVPMVFTIHKNGSVSNVRFNSNWKNLYDYVKINDHPDFINESIRLIKDFNDWEYFSPFPIGYSDFRHEMAVVPSYFCHQAYFDAKSQIVLNPEIPAFYDGDVRKYEYTIQGKYGCDGIINMIVIFEIDGTISNMEYLSGQGKTNFEYAVNALKRLGRWRPAEHNGVPVRSQKALTIYT